LKDDGVVIFNLGSAITGEGSRFLVAELRTYNQVFPHVYLFKVNSNYPDDRLQNLIIIASKSSQIIPLDSSDPLLGPMLEHQHLQPVSLDQSILTDDLAPVEYHSSIAQNHYLGQNRAR
jgi:hypothetical protein